MTPMLTRGQRQAVFVMLVALAVQAAPFTIEESVALAWVVFVLFAVAAVLWGREGLG